MLHSCVRDFSNSSCNLYLVTAVSFECKNTGVTAPFRRKSGYVTVVKVAEHSFRARFCWCNSARAQGLQKKTNMPSIQRSFYLLNTCTICVIFLYNWTQCIDGFSLLLERYVRKGKDAKNPAILSFFFVTERTQLNAAHAYWVKKLRLNENCTLGNTPITRKPLIRISRNLARKYLWK